MVLLLWQEHQPWDSLVVTLCDVVWAQEVYQGSGLSQRMLQTVRSAQESATSSHKSFESVLEFRFVYEQDCHDVEES